MALPSVQLDAERELRFAGLRIGRRVIDNAAVLDRAGAREAAHAGCRLDVRRQVRGHLSGRSREHQPGKRQLFFVQVGDLNKLPGGAELARFGVTDDGAD